MASHLNRLAGIVILSLLSCIRANAETIKVGGTGAAMGSMKRLGEAFERLHPEHTVLETPSLGSTGGIKALTVGAISIALSGRDLKPEERQAGLQAVLYGTTPFVFAAHKSALDMKLSPATLAEIYSGRQSTWPNGVPIRLVTRPRTEGDTALLRKISPAMDQAIESTLSRQGMVVAVTDTDSADQLEKYPNSFGTTTLALLTSEQRDLKMFAVNGVTPSVATISDGSYPYVKDLYLITAHGASSGTRQFVQFILSKQGRDILRSFGHRTYFPR